MRPVIVPVMDRLDDGDPVAHDKRAALVGDILRRVSGVDPEREAHELFAAALRMLAQCGHSRKLRFLRELGF